MPQPESLAHFQSRLLEELWAGRGAEETRAALLADSTLAPFHAYIAGMEIEMIDVASDLVRKWSVGKD